SRRARTTTQARRVKPPRIPRAGHCDSGRAHTALSANERSAHIQPTASTLFDMRVLVPVVLALAFTPVASGGLPNPCALFTNAELGQLLGTKIVERDTSGNRLYRSCKWTGQNLSSSGFY